ncbi:hypothetical protein A2483_03215 [Candidatus Peregrinibacteria bacterium RIFOXYC2_FULL_33_13]|nr:MAG: hypothetical protein UR27_C0015G0018 [Candidatus Peregrinibacteria bacterium GW2011_GWA2_33_10]KKP39520.1 MAG: hypothetical protein UR30_C0010G0016 [Candidatus Peregrinibacteria bacterium GW2011_GWC2_33_13]OGJ46651.1 MAG: hypothetical protein A2229_04505 [Candidatus Peregrinibacteria bacterium RIFOXYA2_FULL_33_7]OGJ53157.1 MAG: hypothetical protein A2483_03215 [Candidatus Peregrinibacteria bacterium RIFOXYC2_FULL_33_13]
MEHKKLIAESWKLTLENKKLILWYAFFPAILTTLIGIIYLTYQIIATWKSQLFSEQHNESILYKIFKTIFDLFQDNPGTGFVLIIISIVIILLYLFVPTLTQGALISLTARISNNQKVRLIDGVSYGFLSFLRLFEYHLLIKSFGILTVFTELAFIGRNFGWLWVKLLSIPMILFGIFSFVILLMFTYAEYFIVIDEEGVFPAIGKSTKLVIKHWPETFLIGILMIIITIRVLVNALLVLLIPTLIILPTGYFASIALGKLGLIIGITLGVIGLLLASYFAAIVEVFSKFVWVKTFLHLTTKPELTARDEGGVDLEIKK